MDITVDHDSPVAPYEQVRLRIAALAADGTLAAGTRLPPVRQLATDLGLAANTVARAYKELEQAGLVETRGRAGTVITARATGTSLRAQNAANTYVQTTRALGIPPDTALALVKAALQA
ncbi:GntR family transcriptional regulator [Actinoplanes regularis]|uniref:Transcriptional regulator, GntR family n=1 Tax=Actinoplanes regularis TaxID=52697 RepID=A0A239BS18_9ACTN|nr:GntR family transcriptional regulator [Actinoplanes regularis]GIE88341.1 GntR family transcriptional regulator [Actinoplanes regularis]GLW30434.1 GntR family transcriptional regulator [Actinoplanes regularis]SNS10208.1 transcriptional regulator, GntR family [Actinoplanes regularis]